MMSIMYSAIINNNTEMIQKILKSGYDLNKTDEDGDVCLHITTESSESSTVIYLL